MTDLFEEKEISPMLLGEEKEPFDDPEYIYELKLDGIRCIAYLEKGKVTLRNKRNKDVTDIYIYRRLVNLFFIINLQSISAFTCNKRAKCATLFAIVKHGLFS